MTAESKPRMTRKEIIANAIVRAHATRRGLAATPLEALPAKVLAQVLDDAGAIELALDIDDGEPLPCGCMNCRIRYACGFLEEVPVDLAAPAHALAEVLAEVLAFVDTRTAKRAVASVLDARKRWQSHPRVAVQQAPRGTA